MKLPRVLLTAQTHLRITTSIRAGGYAHVAAAAWGVPRDVFENWLERGRRKGAREPYRSFAWEVAEAEAQARLRAETGVFSKDPKFWLEHGPARATPDDPGWARPVQAPKDASKEDTNWLALSAFLKTALVLTESCRQHQRLDLADLLVRTGIADAGKPSQGHAAPPLAA